LKRSSGAAYVFLCTVPLFNAFSSNANAGTWPMRWKLFPPAGGSFDDFGTSVSISGRAVALYKLNPVDP
jgi:hypothetical protein